ncbi:MAG: AhpC/TSA family protein [Proteobacteria bacterium]|nr:AhpC/TSA family protein [Pseudomonadota bacterium]
MSEKIKSGGPLPELDLPLAGGGEVRLGGARDGWQMIVVYRGLHCPICKKYLGRLNGMAGDFNEIGIEVVTLSGDPEDKAETAKSEWALDIPVAYGLSTDQMKGWGLYISEPRPQETGHQFPEPALFVINPDGNVHMAEVCNAPFIRPDLDTLLGGLKFVLANDYPIRGTAG